MNKYIEVCNTDGDPVLILRDSIVKVACQDGREATVITVAKDKCYEFIYTYTSYNKVKELLMREDE